jgi:hypothetical protein
LVIPLTERFRRIEESEDMKKFLPWLFAVAMLFWLGSTIA